MPPLLVTDTGADRAHAEPATPGCPSDDCPDRYDKRLLTLQHRHEVPSGSPPRDVPIQVTENGVATFDDADASPRPSTRCAACMPGWSTPSEFLACGEARTCDRGQELMAHAVADWCMLKGTRTVFIDPGSLRQHDQLPRNHRQPDPNVPMAVCNL